jgi:asparagine synthase (glutamine-hydrolysing)
MCGISGIVGFPLGDLSLVSNSVQAIIHRGPDEQGFAKAENFSFGMCRLSVIDVQDGHQPVYSEDKSVTAVYNGEIYNFKQLRKELEDKKYKFRSNADSEIIIPLYLEYGLDFPKKLQGMFAIAIYDNKRKRAILIRDRLGKKPLWYSIKDGQLKFSSEIKGLLALGVARSPNLKVLSEYLQFGYVNAPRSAFLEIENLSPGTILEFSQQRVYFQKYWDLNLIEERQMEYEEAKHEVHSLLINSVESRLISERPLGVFLSGGIDSSLVTAIMSRITKQPVHSFSIGFKESKFDESNFARAMAREIGTIHHEDIVSPSPDLLLNELGRALDQPFADSSIIPSYLLAQFASKEVVVTLGGDGGDEVFGGYERYRATILLDRINFLLSLNPTPYFARFIRGNAKLDKLLRHSRYMKLSDRYRNFQSLVVSSELASVMSNEIYELTQSESSFDIIWKSLTNKNHLRNMQEHDIRSYLPGDLLVKADLATMANSLELRSPFLDYRLVELGLSLPNNFKLRNGTTKFILKDILSEYVPRDFFSRPKMGFAIPRSHWIRGELKELVNDTLLSRKFVQRGWFNQNSIEKILRQHYSGRDLDRIIWPILMLEIWATNWID